MGLKKKRPLLPMARQAISVYLCQFPLPQSFVGAIQSVPMGATRRGKVQKTPEPSGLHYCRGAFHQGPRTFRASSKHYCKRARPTLLGNLLKSADG